ncbi:MULTISPECIES: hypothetical protein [unclassified Enterococcus]|uniref:hypothetical protein n=1 Tax=unclassified Enterococcus TaxID=2608891 RepID=UPI001554F93F|nr:MULTISPECIES: hypothetical protein [unclassified Enterococcus]MBS7578441.1 hypothetical protein [Enterococcus sp. MMGLQ5-2]MBS7585672.1 hypothetical protein [Enterococcus sp. MMGLQ5-1]NPD13531.1 hypothetical protein [Enterococcus sp. MMGLQ5-1]NPD38273.1 hypothetical protein [Enterococcus sp. MMGLQ5-2]
MNFENFKSYLVDSVINVFLLVTILMLIYGSYFLYSENIKINLKPIFLLTSTPFIFTENDNVNCKIRVVLALSVMLISFNLASSQSFFISFNFYLLIMFILLLVNVILYFGFKRANVS